MKRDTGLRKELLTALQEEYGDEGWEDMGSLERVAQRIESIGLRVEIEEELYEPMKARIWSHGRMIFDGLDRSALLTYAGARVRTEYGVRYPRGNVEVMVDEAEARRASFRLNLARPDLPTEVMRKVVTDWEVVPDGGH